MKHEYMMGLFCKYSLINNITFARTVKSSPLAAFHSIASYPDSQLLTLKTRQSDAHLYLRKFKRTHDVSYPRTL